MQSLVKWIIRTDWSGRTGVVTAGTIIFVPLIFYSNSVVNDSPDLSDKKLFLIQRFKSF